MTWTEDEFQALAKRQSAKRARKGVKPDSGASREATPPSDREQPLQRQIMDYLDTLVRFGLWYTKVPLGPMLIASRHVKNPMTGFPDILVCAWGHFLVIEVKVPGKMKRKDQPKQDEVQAALKKAGATVIKADKLETVREIVEMMRP